MKKIILKLLPIILAILFATVAFMWGTDTISSAGILLYRPLLWTLSGLCVAAVFLRSYLGQPVPPKILAMDFARLIKRMMDNHFYLGVFIFEDDWWRLLCFRQTEDGEDYSEKFGEWDTDELRGMLENGVSRMFRNSHLDKSCLVKGVKDVYVERVSLNKNDPETVAINIVYEDV